MEPGSGSDEAKSDVLWLITVTIRKRQLEKLIKISKSKSCGPRNALYLCYELWISATAWSYSNTFCSVFFGPLLQNETSKLRIKSCACTSGGPWLKLLQLNQSPHKGWGRRMGSYKPGGSGHSSCLGMQSYRQIISLREWWIWCKMDFWKETKSYL